MVASVVGVVLVLGQGYRVQVCLAKVIVQFCREVVVLLGGSRRGGVRRLFLDYRCRRLEVLRRTRIPGLGRGLALVRRETSCGREAPLVFEDL